MEQIEIGLKYYPGDIGLSVNKAIQLKKEERYEECVSIYTGLIEKNPELAVLYNNRADTYMITGQLELAYADIQEALKLEPDNDVVNITHGQILQKQGKMDEACEAFKVALAKGADASLIEDYMADCPR